MVKIQNVLLPWDRVKIQNRILPCKDQFVHAHQKQTAARTGEWLTKVAGLLAVDVDKIHVILANVGPQGGTVVDDVNTGPTWLTGRLTASG